MGDTWKDKLLVASIDFGTTYSGFALSFWTDYEKDKTSILTKHWKADNHLVTTKTPTTLLLQPDSTFHSFGFAAEQKYAALAENDEHTKWRYFRRFKMALYGGKVGRGICANSKIKDTAGREFSAMAVFAFSIEYMKIEIIKTAEEKFAVREDDIFYVLTVPAIWSDHAKYFMREAASYAHIPEEHLRIALEPECAAVLIQKTYLPSVAATSNDKSKNIMKPGSCHIIVDLGGAIIYGRDESTVNTRVCRFTLGLDWNEDFEEGKHPESKREETDDGLFCRDIFRIIARKGQSIENNKPTKEIEAYAKSRYQTELDFPFYRSDILDSPKYISDIGCHLMGSMKVYLSGNNEHGVKLKIYCGKTELTAVAEDNNNKKYRMTFKYSETQV